MKVFLVGFTICLIVFALLAWWICTHIEFESCEVTDVKKLMIVQHFNTGHFAQIVDMSMLESHGLAKLDQYFVDIPFEEDEMIEAGFQRRYIEVDDDAGIVLAEGSADAFHIFDLLGAAEIACVNGIKGDLFLCICGLTGDGHEFAKNAAKNGGAN